MGYTNVDRALDKLGEKGFRWYQDRTLFFKAIPLYKGKAGVFRDALGALPDKFSSYDQYTIDRILVATKIRPIVSWSKRPLEAVSYSGWNSSR